MEGTGRLDEGKEKVLCRDIPDENVTKLILVMSNSRISAPLPPHPLPHVQAEAAGCKSRLWLGQGHLAGQGRPQGRKLRVQQRELALQAACTGLEL